METDAVTTENPEQPFQVSIRGMLAIVAGLALLFRLATLWDAPILFVAGPIGVAGWLVWGLLQLSPTGTVFATLGAGLAITAGLAAAGEESCGTDSVSLACEALICSLIGAAAFFVAGAKPPRRQNRRSGWATLLLTPLLLCSLFSVAASIRTTRVLERNSQNAERLEAVVADTNSACARLGRVPEDERELVNALGAPMPQIRSMYGGSSVQYARMGVNHFQLSYNSLGRTFTYDNQAPDRGWVAH